MLKPIELFSLLMVGHFLCDYPLQGDYLAKLKNPNLWTLDSGGPHWMHGAIAHAAIHGGSVGLITGSFGLGLSEFVAHFFIDICKCDKLISYNLDQVLHGLCKILWVVIMIKSH